MRAACASELRAVGAVPPERLGPSWVIPAFEQCDNDEMVDRYGVPIRHSTWRLWRPGNKINGDLVDYSLLWWLQHLRGEGRGQLVEDRVAQTILQWANHKCSLDVVLTLTRHLAWCSGAEQGPCPTPQRPSAAAANCTGPRTAFPLVLPGSDHWVGVGLDHSHRRVIMFDSWRGGNPLERSRQVENVMRAWTAAEESARGIVVDAPWEFEWAQNCPQQVDGSIDCGVFTILALMAWMGGGPLDFDQARMDEFRAALAWLMRVQGGHLPPTEDSPPRPALRPADQPSSARPGEKRRRSPSPANPQVQAQPTQTLRLDPSCDQAST